MAVMQVTATATRDGDRYWLVHVPEIDHYTQARNVGEIETMARDLVSVIRGVPLDDITVTADIKLPGDAAAKLAHAEQLRLQELEARREAAEEVRSAAQALKQAGISLRDIGKLLGVSYQRAGQLTA